MNSVNKVEFDYIVKNNTVIDEHMNYYIEYANKMYYPSEVRIGGDEHFGKYLSVKSRMFLGDDEYSYFVQFDQNGKFISGCSYFANKCRSETNDQNKFKQVLKKEINKLNALHGTAAKLLLR